MLYDRSVYIVLLLALAVVPGCDGDGGGDADADPDVHTDGGGDADLDADTDADGDADGDSESQGDAELDGDLDPDPDIDFDPDIDSDSDTPVEPACDNPALRVLRTHSWPGNGAQLYVEVRDGEGRPEPAADLETLTVRSPGDGEVLHHVERAGETSGITAIIIVPSDDPAVHAQRLAAASALVRELPEGERIGVWRGDARLRLAAELNPRHTRVIQQIEALPGGDAGLPDLDALEELVDDINEVEGPTSAPSRFIVIVGDTARWIEPEGSLASVMRLDGEAEELVACEDRAGWGGAASPELAGRQLAAHMIALRSSLVTIGLCGALAPIDGLAVVRGDDRAGFSLPDPLALMSAVGCDAAAAARNDYPFGDRIDLELTPAEVETWNTYHRTRNESPFTARVRVGGSASMEARIHFRGQGTMGCQRKSLNVELMIDEPLPIIPRSATTEFFLISMCLDEGYFQQTLANRILRQLGLFPFNFRYVEVRRNGESLGVFLLIEKPTHSLRDSMTDVRRVIRRRTGHYGRPQAELKYPPPASPDEAAALMAEFHELAALVGTTAPELLFDTLSQRFDFDLYLLWLALNTLLQNGDYIDETFFYASTELNADRTSSLYYRNTGWDYDDLHVACHHGGRDALRDPWGIVYCAEDEIDQALLLSDEVYSRYIDHLVWLIDDVYTEEIMAAEMNTVRDQLFAVLDEEATCDAMIELAGHLPADPTCADLQAEIQRRMDVFLLDDQSRRFLLEGLIDTWRSAP